MDKRELRRIIGEKKRALSAREIEARSAILADRLLETAAYRQARSLYAYLAFNQEVRTAPIIERAWAEGKRVAVPKVVGGEMRFIWLEDFRGLVESVFGILEPASNGPVADDAAALVLMPGLAFDRQGRRVGYGGGYYDRFLAAEPSHPTVALCYGFQMLDAIETEAHDVRVDIVLSDQISDQPLFL